MSETTPNPMRDLILNYVPEGAGTKKVLAGSVCVAALVRSQVAAGEAVASTGTCYYDASEMFSTNCFGSVALTEGGEVTVTGSEATDGGCIRVQEIDENFSNLPPLPEMPDRTQR